MAINLNEYDFNGSTEEEQILETLTARFLDESQVLVYPTDTIYGLGGRADSEEVIDRVFRIKGRERSKPLSVVVSDLSMLRWITTPKPRHIRFLQELFPAKVSVILPKNEVLPDKLVHDDASNGLAVRIPANMFLRRLLHAVQVPLISTSANPSGEDPPHTWEELQQTWENFEETPDGLVYAEDQSAPQPSTVLDLRGEAPVIIREGAVPAANIYRTWDSIE
jgi:L-threonylcarbamoyladenylate synthase